MEAERVAEELGVRMVKRERYSLADLFARLGKTRAIVVRKQDWRYEDKQGNMFFFHPNMSILRIKHLLQGQNDSLVASGGIIEGDYVLDCTLGMGADAIVSSFVVGESGLVVGLESEPAIAAIVKQGLAVYDSKRPAVNAAMRRIEVIQTDYLSYLQQCPDRSFDVVYFDPMFRQTVKESAAMQTLRPIANLAPLDQAAVDEAIRVARKTVLLKERTRSGEFARLGFSVYKKASNFAWGVIRVEGER